MLPLRREAAAGAPVSLIVRLLARQNQNQGTSNPAQGTTAAIVVSFGSIRPSRLPLESFVGTYWVQVCILLIIAIAISIIVYVSVKASRARRNSPDYIPGDGLATALRRWTGREHSRGEYSTQLQPTSSAPSLIRTRRDGGT